MHRSKKGSTLAEICVALAIVAIVCTLTVMFTMLMSRRTSGTTVRSNAINEVTRIEEVIKTWIRRYDNGQYTFDTAHGKLSVKSGEELCNTLYLLEKEGLYEEESEGDPALLFAADTLLSANFFTMEPVEGDSRGLLYCDVIFYTSGDDDEWETIRYLFTTFSPTAEAEEVAP